MLGKCPELVDHLRSSHDSSQFHLALVRDAVGSIVGLVPLCVARSGLRFGFSEHVLAEGRLRAVRILGSVPLLPADPVPHDVLFAALDQAFADCQVIEMPSVPTDSFLWHHVHESAFVKKKFLPYATRGARRCHIIPLPTTVESYLAKFGAKKRYNLKRQTRILRDHFGGRLELRRFDSLHQIGDLFDLITPAGEFAGLRGWGEKAITIDRREAESYATRGLMLIYVLIGAGRPCAALMGLKYQDVYYLDGMSRDRSLDRFSPGSTAIHLAIEDLIRNTSIRRIDLGFGTPAYSHSATNVTEFRASLLLFRRTLANKLLRATLATFESLIDLGKSCIGRVSRAGQTEGQLVSVHHCL
jgi:hypothetical protein